MALRKECKKDYEKLGQAAAALAEATTFDNSEGNQKLLKALRVRNISKNVPERFWENIDKISWIQIKNP